MVLLSALAIHSVLETMALGLCDTPVQATLLACSIALHQPAESIALLVSFLKSNLTHAQITRYLSIFSAVGPLGLLTGRSVCVCVCLLWREGKEVEGWVRLMAEEGEEEATGNGHEQQT